MRSCKGVAPQFSWLHRRAILCKCSLARFRRLVARVVRVRLTRVAHNEVPHCSFVVGCSTCRSCGARPRFIDNHRQIGNIPCQNNHNVRDPRTSDSGNATNGHRDTVVDTNYVTRWWRLSRTVQRHVHWQRGHVEQRQVQQCQQQLWVRLGQRRLLWTRQRLLVVHRLAAGRDVLRGPRLHAVTRRHDVVVID